MPDIHVTNPVRADWLALSRGTVFCTYYLFDSRWHVVFNIEGYTLRENMTSYYSSILPAAPMPNSTPPDPYSHPDVKYESTYPNQPIMADMDQGQLARYPNAYERLQQQYGYTNSNTNYHSSSHTSHSPDMVQQRQYSQYSEIVENRYNEGQLSHPGQTHSPLSATSPNSYTTPPVATNGLTTQPNLPIYPWMKSLNGGRSILFNKTYDFTEILLTIFDSGILWVISALHCSLIGTRQSSRSIWPRWQLLSQGSVAVAFSFSDFRVDNNLSLELRQYNPIGFLMLSWF
jgi:hypothetical protein